MCGEIVTVCSDCGAERFLFWDQCKSYWRLYAEALQDEHEGVPGVVRPHPVDCNNHDYIERDANIGTCPNLQNCLSKVRLELQQREAKRRHIAAVQQMLELQRLDRSYKEAFAKAYFQKRPVAPAPPSSTTWIEYYLEKNKKWQAEIKKQHEQREQQHKAGRAAIKDMMLLKRAVQNLAFECGTDSEGSESENHVHTQASASTNKASPPGSSLRQEFEVSDSGIALARTNAEEPVRKPDSGIALSMHAEEARERSDCPAKPSKPTPETAVLTGGLNAMPRSASSETIIVAGLNIVPKRTSADAKVTVESCTTPDFSLIEKNDESFERFRREAAGTESGWGMGFGVVGYAWGRISARLGILR